ncbi:hypothetical protein P8841_18170 [Bacillus spizizenii]|nr:hypothetical protein [Bacillus spizizenii]MEC0567680.1 hypothetical protein [Bacillus spizizenii]MEC1570633.1 hypothetical protein [Bacillus spizizenii]
MDFGWADRPWCVCDLVQPRVCTRLGRAALGMLGFNVICGSVAGYLIDRAIQRYRRR